MLTILYLIFFLGSFSLGYAIIRIGFPKTQEKSFIEKIGQGYLMGLIIFLPSILSIYFELEKFFFLFAAGSIGFISIIMLIIRTYLKKEDDVNLISDSNKQFIPNKVLTKEEKEQINYNQNNSQANNNLEKGQIKLYDIKHSDADDFKKEKAKELGVEEKLDKINHSVTGIKQNGLFVKDSSLNKNESQRQIFKEKEPNVINKFREKTIGFSVNQEEERKKQAMEQLKGLVKNLNNKNEEKKKINQENELEELNDIDEEF